MFGSLELFGRSVKGCLQLVLSQLLKFNHMLHSAGFEPRAPN